MEEGGLMALWENFLETCTVLEKKREDDDHGGYTTEWTDGVKFRAAIVKDRTLQARIAEKEGVTEVYTITTEPGVALDYHEVFRREADKTTFRVTSNARDSKPPEVASFSFEQVSAERWSLT